LKISDTRDESGREDRYFMSNGVALRYVEEGSGNPVVLVHGYTVDIEQQWVESGVFDRLSRRFRTIALDNRGHGKSGKPREPSAYGLEMVHDLFRLLDHLGEEAAHFVGYSMGSMIVAKAATTSPGRFLSATLAGGPRYLAWTDEDQAMLEREAAEMEHAGMADLLMRQWPSSLPRPPYEEFQRRSETALAGKDVLAYANARRSVRDLVMGIHDFASLPVPLLCIIGADDQVIVNGRALELALGIELTVIDHASHASAPGDPAFSRALEGFVSRHSR
jgi:pimeloyl-ACP methyl ester carboxylesterase